MCVVNSFQFPLVYISQSNLSKMRLGGNRTEKSPVGDHWIDGSKSRLFARACGFWRAQTHEVLCFQNIYFQLVHVEIHPKLKLNIQHFTSGPISLKQEFGIAWQWHFLNIFGKCNFSQGDQLPNGRYWAFLGIKCSFCHTEIATRFELLL